MSAQKNRNFTELGGQQKSRTDHFLTKSMPGFNDRYIKGIESFYVYEGESMNAIATYSEYVAPFYNADFVRAKRPMTAPLKGGRITSYSLSGNGFDYLSNFKNQLVFELPKPGASKCVIENRINYARQLKAAAYDNGLPGFIDKLNKLPGGAVQASDIHREALKYVKEGFEKFVPIPAVSFFDEAAVSFVPSDSWLFALFDYADNSVIEPISWDGLHIPIAVDGGYVPFNLIKSDKGLLPTMDIIFHEAHHSLFSNARTFVCENIFELNDLFRIIEEGACTKLTNYVLTGLIYRDSEFMTEHEDVIARERHELPLIYDDETSYFIGLCRHAGSEPVASFLGHGDHAGLSEYYGENWDALLKTCGIIQNRNQPPIVWKAGFNLLKRSAEHPYVLKDRLELLRMMTDGSGQAKRFWDLYESGSNEQMSAHMKAKIADVVTAVISGFDFGSSFDPSQDLAGYVAGQIRKLPHAPAGFLEFLKSKGF